MKESPSIFQVTGQLVNFYVGHFNLWYVVLTKISTEVFLHIVKNTML